MFKALGDSVKSSFSFRPPLTHLMNKSSWVALRTARVFGTLKQNKSVVNTWVRCGSIEKQLVVVVCVCQRVNSYLTLSWCLHPICKNRSVVLWESTIIRKHQLGPYEFTHPHSHHNSWFHPHKYGQPMDKSMDRQQRRWHPKMLRKAAQA